RDPVSLVVQVGQQATLRPDVGVRDVHAHEGALAGHHANLGHIAPVSGGGKSGGSVPPCQGGERRSGEAAPRSQFQCSGMKVTEVRSFSLTVTARRTTLRPCPRSATRRCRRSQKYPARCSAVGFIRSNGGTSLIRRWSRSRATSA